MRVKQSKSRQQKIAPAQIRQRRRSRRRFFPKPRDPRQTLVPIRAQKRRLDPMEMLSYLAVALIGIMSVVLIWSITERSITEQAIEIRARADLHVKGATTVLARELHDEMTLVDQSISIIQDAWKKDPDTVDLGAWRKQMMALTAVANDIFIANERRIIVQGTLPQSIGQGFGTAYVTYPNGSLETFEPDGGKSTVGLTAAATALAEPIQARQFLMYVLRPLERPRGWMVGASFRSEGLTKLFAGANLGENGAAGFVDLTKGAMQALAGTTARFGRMTLQHTDLLEQMRKNESGIWFGQSPWDQIPRIIAYERVPGRDMAVVMAMTSTYAYQPMAGLAAFAHGVATAASIVVVIICGIVIWTVATARESKARARAMERAETNLANARDAAANARARSMLSEQEAGALLASQSDGVARLDEKGRIRQWNQRFADYAGVPLLPSEAGLTFEALIRRQADAGLFGGPEETEQAVGTRLTVLHTGIGSPEPLLHPAASGDTIQMMMRPVSDGGGVLVLIGPDNAAFAALPPLAEPVEAEPEPVDETTDW
jgi:PAS domain-containing protein